MAALECNLKGVLTDQADVLESELFRVEILDARQAAGRSCFTTTFRARASPSELLAGINALVAVLPCNGHQLSLAIDVDVEWKRVAILQLLYRPLPDVDDRQLPEGLD